MGMDPARLEEELAESLRLVPYVEGVNNHMGSRFTSDPASARALCATLRRLRPDILGISAESRGEALLGQIAVGNVVLNRAASADFPNTIYSVIFDSRWGGQFEPVRNGTIYDAPAPSSIVAAKLCLEGANAVGDSLYFLAPALTSNHWAMNQRTYVTTIGCHWFYR